MTEVTEMNGNEGTDENEGAWYRDMTEAQRLCWYAARDKARADELIGGAMGRGKAYALGRGLGFGIGIGLGIGLSSWVTFTLLREMGAGMKTGLGLVAGAMVLFLALKRFWAVGVGDEEDEELGDEELGTGNGDGELGNGRSAGNPMGGGAGILRPGRVGSVHYGTQRGSGRGRGRGTGRGRGRHAR